MYFLHVYVYTLDIHNILTFIHPPKHDLLDNQVNAQFYLTISFHNPKYHGLTKEFHWLRHYT